MSSEQENKRGITLTPSVLLIGTLIIVVIILAVLLIISLNKGAATGDPTPTPFADALGPAAGNVPLVVGVSDTDTISVTLDVPAMLQVGGLSFPVKAEKVSEEGGWAAAFEEEEETAVWVYGTIINYIVGLPDTEANRALLGQLTPGDQMALTTRNGVSYAFAFDSRDNVLVGNPDVYAQHTPGLTLILLGSEGEERLVVNGRYLADETSNTGTGQANAVELGEITQLDDVQITVTGAAYVLDRPEAQPGFAFYLVDYQIQNIGLTALDTSRLQLTLSDELGNQYAVNPVAGQLGNYPALGGYLNASQTAQATAGYQVPVGLNSANVFWTVTNLTSGAQLQVTIPFSGGARAAQSVQITLTDAAVSADLTSLTLSGKIFNFGNQPVNISESDISLWTDDGSAYLLLSTNPAFPWTVGAGQTVQYVVTFQRPIAADTAVLTVLNQPFQLTNLR